MIDFTYSLLNIILGEVYLIYKKKNAKSFH